MKKSSVIEGLMERIDILEKWRKGDKKKEDKPEDEDVCPVCGGNLDEIDEEIVYCSKCKQYYDLEEATK